MKKLIIILAVIALTVSVNAQIRKSGGFTATMDTLDAASTKNSTAVQITGKGDVVIQALATQLGGTSDGFLYLDASVDGTTYNNLISTAGIVYGFPNDTLTITSGASVTWTVTDGPWEFYRVRGLGTANDTTLVSIKYNYKGK
ncbi:hypothetical protein KAR91_38980 [Candidatus Pacearchaeota archaeon]|nr:hypothetical protein [Candidatus Pacearchaeota archaeon]